VTDDDRDAPDGSSEPAATAGPAFEHDDDLAGVRSPMQRLVRSTRTWLAIVVVVALVVPAVAFLGDELDFRRSSAEVVATLEGERRGTAAAETVLLVRAVGCSGRNATGTAFVVDTDDGPALLTNRHVVDDARTVGVRWLDGATGVRVVGVRLSRSADVAVLEVDDPEALPPALTLATSDPGAGTTVRLVGFPAARPFTDAGSVADVDGSRLLLDVDVAPGASGSPVVDERGAVVGQVFAVTAEGLGVATPATRLLTATADAEPATGC
jgi:S1-C subfamily serine protease